jgi:hypothetical protein
MAWHVLCALAAFDTDLLGLKIGLDMTLRDETSSAHMCGLEVTRATAVVQ